LGYGNRSVCGKRVGVHGIGNLSELFVRLAFFVEGLLEKIDHLIFSENLPRCARRALAGHFMVFHALGLRLVLRDDTLRHGQLQVTG
jgi:hypothetical protein